MTDFVEIPFGARDSELYKFEYTIPEGYIAEIVDGKVIVRKNEDEWKNEDEDEKIKNTLLGCCDDWSKGRFVTMSTRDIDKIRKWIKKQKEQKPEHFELKAGKWYICHRAYCCRADHLTVKEGERFMCEKDGVVKGFIIKEPEKYFIECSVPAPMEDEQKEQKPVANDVQQECPYKDLALVKDFFGKYKRKCKLSNKACDSKECEQWNELQAEFKRINEAFENGKNEVINRPEIFGLQKPAEWSEEDRRIADRIQMILEFYDRLYPEIGSEIPKYISWLKNNLSLV